MDIPTITPSSPGTAERPHALVVEDEDPSRELLRLHLTIAGFDVTGERDGRTAVERVRKDRYDLILLDLMLPGVDGVTLCRIARDDGPNAFSPILMLTARRSETDAVLGLQSGADDYITKPFGVQELLARVEAVMRRSGRQARSAPARRGVTIDSMALELDLDRRSATVRGKSVDLTRQEFDVLYLLASRPGVVFSRSALLAHAWPRDITVTGRTVDTVVSRLRHKVEADPDSPQLVMTVWGVGYKCADDKPGA
jgi:two-component system, OmpR family, response regulator